MNQSAPKKTDHATLAAAEGQAALGVGDTALAKVKFVEAGEILLKEMKASARLSDKTLKQFLAATQFYKGGEYKRAFESAKKIQPRDLPQRYRHLLPDFISDAKHRSSEKYVVGMRQTFAKYWFAGEHQKILDLLKEHPFVYEAGPLAFLRAVICQHLGQWRAAAFFYSRVLPGLKDGSDVILMAVSTTLQLPSQGRVDEAWESITYLRETFPNSVTLMVSSITCFHLACRKKGEERLELHKEQMRYFDDAWRIYRTLPEEVQNKLGMRMVMSICFEAASLALMRIGDEKKAQQISDEAINFEPSLPGPLTSRAMLTYPSERALKDFRKASEHPFCGYAPFYYLAHHAMETKQFNEAIAYCHQAIERRPGPIVAAQLQSWIAICRHVQGATPEEVEGIFKQAFRIDPDNEWATENYRIFKKIESAVPINRLARWDTRLGNDTVQPELLTQESDQLKRETSKKTLEDMLLTSAN